MTQHQPKRSFIVEFVGLPGAGKTTISHAVADALRLKGKNVTEQTFDITLASDRRSQKVILALFNLCRHPYLSFFSFIKIIKSRQKSLSDVASSAFNIFYICGLMKKISQKPGIHFIDQGYYNAFWTVYFSASPDKLESCDVESILDFNRVSRPDMIFLVEAAPETIVERLQKRPGAGSRLERQLDTPHLNSGIVAAMRAFEQVRNLLDAVKKNDDGIYVETIYNDVPFEESQFNKVKMKVRDTVLKVTNRET